MTSHGATDEGARRADDAGAAEEAPSRRRRGAVVAWTLGAGTRVESRRAFIDVLSTFAVILGLLGVTGYVNASPLGGVVDDLDALFAEVWDSADETTTSPVVNSLLDMLQAAQEDHRLDAASREQTSAAPPATTADQRAESTPAAPGPAGSSAGQSQSAPQVIPNSSAVVPSLAPATTPGANPGAGALATAGPAGPRPASTTSGQSDGGSAAAPAPANGQAPPAGGPTVAPAATRRAVSTAGAEPTTEAIATPPPESTVVSTPASTVPALEPTVIVEQAATLAPTANTAETATPASTATSAGTVTPSPTASPAATATSSPTATPPPTSTPEPTATPVGTATPAPGQVLIRTDAPAYGFIDMANMRPGAWLTRNVNVFNDGQFAFLSYTLTTAAVDAPTPLWTDPVHGLRLRVRRGTTVIYEGPIAVTDLDLGASIAPGGTDTLELGVYLPVESGNVAQGWTQTISITWTATGG